MREGAERKSSAMYCVIVGDIINSKEIIEPDKREAVMLAVKSVLSSINAKYNNAIMADFGIVRGDGFEGVLLAKHLAPKVIQEIIQGFYLADKTCVRIAAVVGELSIVSNDRNECDGPAFHRSLELLESLKAQRSEHWLQAAMESGQPAQPVIDSILGLMSALTKGWTEKQRETAWVMDAYGSNISVAKALGIKPSVVSKQLKAANYEEYRAAWKSLEQYLMI